MRIFEKFIFLGFLVFLAAFSIRNSLGKTEGVENSPKITTNNSLDASLNSTDRETEISYSREPGNVLNGSAPVENKLSFFRIRATVPPEIKAQAAIIGDIATGEIYYSAGENNLWPLASITKLMSGVVVVKNLKMEDRIVIEAEDLTVPDNRFLKIFVPGAVFSVGDLNKALLVSSSNESADALARTMGRTKFITAMNDQARAWGLTSTFFKDPSGVSASNQGSVSDLLKLSRHIYNEYPSVFGITDNAKSTITELNSGSSYSIYSTHQFAAQGDYLGGKTGTTPEAGENLLTVISYGGRPVGIIVLGTTERFEDTSKLIKWFKNDFSPGY